MSEHDPKAEERNEERIEDLDVPESESEDVKGGLLPAVEGQKFVKLQKFQKVDFQQKVNPGDLGGKWGDGSV
jgi:hypothetical protein